MFFQKFNVIFFKYFLILYFFKIFILSFFNFVLFKDLNLYFLKKKYYSFFFKDLKTYSRLFWAISVCTVLAFHVFLCVRGVQRNSKEGGTNIDKNEVFL